MHSSSGPAPGFIRPAAPVTSPHLLRAVAASLVIAVASLGTILALTLLSAQCGDACGMSTPFAL
ncbi:HtrA2 peptidase [Rhodopseudomonas palustris]|nr:HtrA2 peptidase [Rhodopseudomonas palustris]